MRVIAQRWGNSIGIRIPKSFTVNANIAEGTEIDLEFDNGNIIIKPIQKKQRTLDDYLGMVTPENIHHETETGDFIGNEIW